MPYGDLTGHFFTYTVDEITVLDEYVKSISTDGKTITNTFKEVSNPNEEEDLTPIDPIPEEKPKPEEKPQPKPEEKPNEVLHKPKEKPKPEEKPVLPPTGVSTKKITLPVSFIAIGMVLIKRRYQSIN